jgi:hypothetical protein
LAVYGILLTRWSKTQLRCIVYPLIILFCVIFSGSSHSAFFFIAIATLSWIRSGICFQKPFPGVLIGELILGFGGGALVNFFTPHSTITWAMGLWVFFLVQALYFVVFGEIDAAEEKRKATQDPFEEIRRRAEKVLSTGLP